MATEFSQDQIRYFKFATLAELKAATGCYDGIRAYCIETETLYKYLADGSAYNYIWSGNNTSVLSTADGDVTKWVGISGKYVINNGNIATEQQDLKLNELSPVGVMTYDGITYDRYLLGYDPDGNSVPINSYVNILPSDAFPEGYEPTKIVKGTTGLTAAEFDGTLLVGGVPTAYVITADNPGTIGNNIGLNRFYAPLTTVNAKILAWNIANPTNAVTLTSGNGTLTPDLGESLSLTGGTNLESLYMIERGNNRLFRSDDGGASRTDLTTPASLSPTQTIKDIAVAKGFPTIYSTQLTPENGNIIAIVVDDPLISRQDNVARSNDFGATWSYTGVPDAICKTPNLEISCIDIRINGASNTIIMGTRDPANDVVTLGNMWMYDTSSTTFSSLNCNFTAGAFSYNDGFGCSITSIQFSPNFNNDDVVVVTGLMGTDVFPTAPGMYATLWNNSTGWSQLADFTPVNFSDIPGGHTTFYSYLAIPFDFDARSKWTQHFYCAYDCGNQNAIYHFFSNLYLKYLGLSPKGIYSMDYRGTWAAGKLIYGCRTSDGTTPDRVSNYFTDGPMINLFSLARLRPSGAANSGYGNACVKRDPQFAWQGVCYATTSSAGLATPADRPSKYLDYDALDGNQCSYSNNNSEYRHPGGLPDGATKMSFDAAGTGYAVCPSAGTVHKTYGTLINPEGVYIDGGGNIWICDTQRNRVQKYDSTGNLLLKFGSSGTGNGQFNQPMAICTNHLGQICVTDFGNDRVQIFNTSGVYQSKFGTTGTGDGQFTGPIGIVFASDFHYYIVDSGNDRIQKIDTSGVYQGKFGTTGSGDGEFSTPRGIVIDGSGYLLITDTGNNRVQKFTTAGVFQTKFGTYGLGDGQFITPRGITDIAGDIYVVDSNNYRIQKFNSSYVYQAKVGTGGDNQSQFDQPRGLASDGTYIYVADMYNNRIQKFNTSLTYQTEFNIGREDITANLTGSGATAPFRDIVVCQDNVAEMIAVSDSGSNTPTKLYQSTDTGANWSDISPTLGVGEYISCIDYSIDIGTGARLILVGTRDLAGGGNLYIYQGATWYTQTLPDALSTADIVAAKFSPTFPGDASLVIVFVTSTGTFYNVGIYDYITTNDTTWVWDLPGYASIEVKDTGTSATTTELITATIELPGDFSGQSGSLRRSYITIDDAGAGSDAGLFRIDDNVPYMLDATTSSTTKRYSSNSYFGTYASGKILVGEVLEGIDDSDTTPVWFSDMPTTGNAMPTRYPSLFKPFGPGNCCAIFSWASSGLPGDPTLYCTTGLPIPYPGTDYAGMFFSYNNGETRIPRLMNGVLGNDFAISGSVGWTVGKLLKIHNGTGGNMLIENSGGSSDGIQTTVGHIPTGLNKTVELIHGLNGSFRWVLNGGMQNTITNTGGNGDNVMVRYDGSTGMKVQGGFGYQYAPPTYDDYGNMYGHTFQTTGSYFEDDFFGLESPQWTTRVTTGSVTFLSAENGIVLDQTGAVTSDEESSDWNDICNYVSYKLPSMEWMGALGTLIATKVEIGIIDVTPDQYIKFVYDASVDNYWHLQTWDGATLVDIPSLAIATSNTVKLRFSWPYGIGIEFFVDDVSQGTYDYGGGGIPGTAMQPFRAITTQTTSVAYLYTDYIRIRQRR